MILDAFRLTDQVAIVTGAGVGIGREIAVAFAEAEAGADVVVVARTASDLGETAIGVGGVATQSMDFVMSDDSLRTQYESNTPMARIGTPRDIAAAAVYLASPASAWVTGVMLRVDGGTTKPAFELPAPALAPTQRQETP